MCVKPKVPGTPCKVLEVVWARRRKFQSKKIPLTTALTPPVFVTLICTSPVTFQAAYSPLWKLENVSVSRTAPLTAFRTDMLSVRAVESQSSKYSAMRWVFPSVTFTLIVKLLVE